MNALEIKDLCKLYNLSFQHKGSCPIFAAAVIIVLIENRVFRVVARHKRGGKNLRKFTEIVTGFDPDGAAFVVNTDGTADGIFLIGTVKTDPVSAGKIGKAVVDNRVVPRPDDDIAAGNLSQRAVAEGGTPLNAAVSCTVHADTAAIQHGGTPFDAAIVSIVDNDAPTGKKEGDFLSHKSPDGQSVDFHIGHLLGFAGHDGKSVSGEHASGKFVF